MSSKEKLRLIYKKMISQIIAEVAFNISSILTNFKSFIEKYIKRNGRKILKSKRIKIITSEQK